MTSEGNAMWLLPLINGYWTQIALGALMFAIGLQRWQRLLYGKAAMLVGIEMAGLSGGRLSTTAWQIYLYLGISLLVSLLVVREGLRVTEDGEPLGFGYVGAGVMLLDYTVWTLQRIIHIKGPIVQYGHVLFVGIAIAAFVRWLMVLVRKEGRPLDVHYYRYEDLD